jgi:hypothetical protein
MPLPSLARVAQMLSQGAAASTDQRIRVDWNSFQNRLKYNTLRLCFAGRPYDVRQARAAYIWEASPFRCSRILIDGILSVSGVAFSTVLCVGVPIMAFRRLGIASASSINPPWSILNQIQELIVYQACSGPLIPSISLACVACASFVIEANLGSPRLAMLALLPNINGIVPHQAIARARPLDRLFARIRGICISSFLRALFFSCCLPTPPSFRKFAAAVLAPLPLRLLGVLYLEFGRVLLHMYPVVSQLVAATLQAPQVVNEDGDRPEPELALSTERLHIELARSGLVFHSNHLPNAPIEFIHERVVSSFLLNPFVFSSELRSWHMLLQALDVASIEFPGFWKRLLLGLWFQGCAEMLQNGLIASSLVLNEIAAYLWGEEEPRAA